MGKHRFAMIGERFAYRLSHNDVLKTADRWFQNGRRVKKMASCCVFTSFPHLPGSKNGGRMQDFCITVSFLPIGTH